MRYCTWGLPSLPPCRRLMHNGLINAFSSSLHSVFLWAVPFGLVAFGVSLLLREVPLREQSARGVCGCTVDGAGP